MPEYNQLFAAKEDLHPEGIVVSADGKNAQCPMQSVLQHSVERLLVATDIRENVMVVEGKYNGTERQYLLYFKSLHLF